MGKNTGVGNHSLLQGIFLTQGSNLDFLHVLQADYLPSEPPGNDSENVSEDGKDASEEPGQYHFKKHERGWNTISTLRLSICWNSAAATAKSLQSCPTLCDPRDGSPPGSPVPGILQARTLEWVTISFSNAWKWKVKVKSLSRIQLLATPWTAAYQASLSMGFSRQEYCSEVPSPSPAETLNIIINRYHI